MICYQSRPPQKTPTNATKRSKKLVVTTKHKKYTYQQYLKITP